MENEKEKTEACLKAGKLVLEALKILSEAGVQNGKRLIAESLMESR